MVRGPDIESRGKNRVKGVTTKYIRHILGFPFESSLKGRKLSTQTVTKHCGRHFAGHWMYAKMVLERYEKGE